MANRKPGPVRRIIVFILVGSLILAYFLVGVGPVNQFQPDNAIGEAANRLGDIRVLLTHVRDASLVIIIVLVYISYQLAGLINKPSPPIAEQPVQPAAKVATPPPVDRRPIFKVHGLDNTGQHKTMLVRARNETEAWKAARQHGMADITEVEPASRDEIPAA